MNAKMGKVKKRREEMNRKNQTSDIELGEAKPNKSEIQISKSQKGVRKEREREP